jgi:hypothetical protein
MFLIFNRRQAHVNSFARAPTAWVEVGEKRPHLRERALCCRIG